MRVIEALPHLAEIRDRMHITHQTGARDREYVEKGYRAVGFEPDVREFISDMSAAYAGCDLVVCRAGATTIAELTVCRRPSILVPFPAAADNHQAANARSLVEVGAAVMIEERDLTGELLAAEIRRLLLDPAARDRMARAAGSLGAPQAASEIAEVLSGMVRRRWGSPAGRARAPGWKPLRFPTNPVLSSPPDPEGRDGAIVPHEGSREPAAEPPAGQVPPGGPRRGGEG
jgi:UDP-N-acetylglucosamine--N-acetylmuramyl-(pentapeptide) pyrophosphoryl-undecaprenol N-acetylglucosamine transferase